MTEQPNPDTPQGQEGEPSQPVVNDRRRIDPETGQVRQGASQEAASADEPGLGGEPTTSVPDDASSLDSSATTLAEERLLDLQRLQAEYVNYRRRVERDRDVAKDRATAAVLEAMLPVLDDIELSRQHGDLEGGPFAAISEKLESVLARQGLERYGETGVAFDPEIHEALLHSESDEVAEPTVSQVLQPGYKLNEKVLRAARVAVTAPA